jgi:hypothetical protein
MLSSCLTNRGNLAQRICHEPASPVFSIWDYLETKRKYHDRVQDNKTCVASFNNLALSRVSVYANCDKDAIQITIILLVHVGALKAWKARDQLKNPTVW